MSNLGFQTIYKLFNADVDCVCERVFLDSLEPKQPLRTLETNRPVHESDLVAFSISFENDYLNIPSLLHQANIPLLAMDRREHDPLVLAGGTAITINPEPVRPFFDAFFIGEAEEAIPSLLEVLNSGRSRRDKLERLSQIDGCVASHQVQNLQKRHDMICPSAKSLPAYNIRVDQEQLTQYRRHHIENLNRYPTHTVIHTPHTEFGDTSLIEVQKGCDYGCKFCAECFVAAPFRERSLDMIQSQICRALKHRKRIGLIGTSLLKHADFQGICEFIHAAGGTFTPSSLRANDLTDSVIALLTLSGHKTVSLAPEAGTDRLRFSLNKKITNSVLLEKIRLLADSGMHRIKLYFMIGLPHETDED
ncbi:MAG: radical SAM family protein, partial [uncultured bacterium]